MFKRLIALLFLLMAGYVVFVMVQINKDVQKPAAPVVSAEEKEQSETYKIYNFSFSKYNMAGAKELEIEGDSADMLAKVVRLNNVIAKAYADDIPVTITADTGEFDKGSSLVKLEKNVVATTDDGDHHRSQ